MLRRQSRPAIRLVYCRYGTFVFSDEGPTLPWVPELLPRSPATKIRALLPKRCQMPVQRFFSLARLPPSPSRRFFLRVRKKLWHPGLAYARNVVDFTVSVSAVHQPFYIRSVQVSISACSQNNYFAERQNFQVARKATITPLRHMCSISKYKKLVYCRCRKCLTFQA